jgi:hypothetical protein
MVTLSRHDCAFFARKMGKYKLFKLLHENWVAVRFTRFSKAGFNELINFNIYPESSFQGLSERLQMSFVIGVYRALDSK